MIPNRSKRFEQSKISWDLLQEPEHRTVINLYCELIQLRKRCPCLHNGRKDLTRVDFDEGAQWLRMERSDPSGGRAVLFCNFSNGAAKPNLDASTWTLALTTASAPDGPSAVPACSASLFLANL